MLWIVSGPASVGKSTFLLSDRCGELTGLPPTTPVLWRKDVITGEPRVTADHPAFLHHSLTRGWRERQREARAEPKPTMAATTLNWFAPDLPLMRHLAADRPLRVIVLVASTAVILERLRRRTEREDHLARERPFRVERRSAQLDRQQVTRLYRQWLTLLRHHAIPTDLIHADAQTYTRLRLAVATARFDERDA